MDPHLPFVKVKGMSVNFEDRIDEGIKASQPISLTPTTVVSISSSTELTYTTGIHVVLANPVDGTIVVELPTAKGNTAIIPIKKINSSTGLVAIVPRVGEKIESTSTYTLAAAFNYVMLKSDECTNWYLI